ncbi:hypothetical protein D0T11_18160 [Hymenobacter rubripertinctus]|uniref:Uncharacterized protein n=1 Tax=Hymenobacter rubripertinctus TaxID=2029981 RepID=A0A418QN81_9BACT|nr:hypothetical protein D0T11_18160 [Hymenobacter rubripertinctus]
MALRLGGQRVVALLHGRDGSVEQGHLGVNLVGVHGGQEGGRAAAVGAALLQLGLLVSGRQQLVLVAAAVGGREIGAGQLVGEVANLAGGRGQAGSHRNLGAAVAAVLEGQVLVAVLVAVDFGFQAGLGLQALRPVFEGVHIVRHN